MHPVADKVHMKAFDGTVNLLGRNCGVAYTPDDESGTSCFVISGFTIEEVWEALDCLSRARAAASTNGVKEAPVSKVKTDMVEEVKKVAPPGDSSSPVVTSDDDAPEPDLEPTLDVAYMSKQDKLRPVIEHMISRGYNTPAKIVELAKVLVDKVPLIKAVHEKGGFEKRMDKAAMVVLGHDGAAA